MKILDDKKQGLPFHELCDELNDRRIETESLFGSIEACSLRIQRIAIRQSGCDREECASVSAGNACEDVRIEFLEDRLQGIRKRRIRNCCFDRVCASDGNAPSGGTCRDSGFRNESRLADAAIAAEQDDTTLTS